MDSHNRGNSSDIYDKSRQLQQKSKEAASLLDFDCPLEVKEVTSSDGGLNGGVLTPVSDAAKIIDTPQNQVAVHQQPPRSPYQLHDDNWAATDEADLDAPRPRVRIGGYEACDPDCSILDLPIDITPTNADESPTLVSPRSSIISPVRADQHITNFQHLDEESKDLATILVFLGGADVPESMLLRGCQPRRFWSPAGEIEEVPALGLMPALTDADKLTLAIQRLECLALVTSKAGPLGRRSFAIDSSMRVHIEECTQDPNVWYIQATKLVFHTFPMDRDIEPYL